MKIHRAGYGIVGAALIVLAIFIIFASYYVEIAWIKYSLIALLVAAYFLFISFFRNPGRDITLDDNAIYSVADGKVVVIEETEEMECLKERCLQVSVFMNVNNVHINWYPVNGRILYVHHSDGNYKKAFLPKSSEMNEHTTILIERGDGKRVVMRQIAGAVARRIVTYAKVGDLAKQTEEAGFIKFGSRIDLFLPLDTKIEVKLGDKAIGSQTVIGRFAE